MRWAAAWLMILCAAGRVGWADQEYTIQAVRPVKVGDVYQFRENLEQVSTTTMTPAAGAPAVSEQRISADLEGRLEVQAIDDAGNQTSAALTVTRFIAGDARRPVLTPGKVIHIKRTTKDVSFDVEGGGTLDDEARKALARIFQPISADTFTSEMVLGSTKARKAGESWSIDAADLYHRALGKQAHFDPRDATGTMTLKGVERMAGIEGLRLVFSSTLKNFALPGPAGYTTERSELTMEVSQLLPVDAKLPVIALESTAEMRSVLTSAQTHDKIEVHTHVVEKRSTVPVPR